MRTAFYSDIGGRACNEDTVRIIGHGNAVCAVVADGLGGHGGGSIASQAVAETICEYWQGEADPQVLVSLGQRAHRAVQQCQTPECAMKSTMVLLALKDGTAAWTHAGDSRLYRFRNGALEFQTRDHSASQIAVLMGDITPDQIRFHPDRSKVIRALGQEGDLKFDAASARLGPGQYGFLLCTDGFWEYVTEAEMEEDLRSSRHPQEWVQKMRQRLEARVPEHNDNNTAAAIWLELA